MKKELKILILEDSAADAGMIKHTLKKSEMNFIAKVVDTKIDFENAMREFVPDVILSDHGLLNFNSMEALKITKDLNADVPFILVTGAVSEEFAVECMKAGADDYILKKSLLRLPSAIENTLLKKEVKREKEKAESFHKKAEAEFAEGLKKANKELEHFAYVVSHDLKAPLRAISNLSQWIEDDLGTGISEEVKKSMLLLRGRVQRMESLINGVLEYSRVGRVKENIQSVDVKKLLTELIDSIAPPAGFAIEIKDTMPVLDTEKVKLQQVFSNLISNAIKYNHRRGEGRVMIDCVKNEDSYCFSVQDNGPGIAPEFHEKIFQIFQTLEARDKVESTGIGLTIVKKIIEERGGKIWIESEKDKGAKFLFTWNPQTVNE